MGAEEEADSLHSFLCILLGRFNCIPHIDSQQNHEYRELLSARSD